MTGRIFLIVVCLSVIIGNARAKNWLAFEPEQVTLRGVLVLEKHAGPPNYGEGPKDSEVLVPVLNLSPPVNVRGSPQSEINRRDVQGAKAVQLVGNWKQAEIGKFTYTEITVQGTLFSAHTGHHFHKLLMNVAEIMPVSEGWKSVSNELLEAVRAQDMAALLSIFKSPEYYQDDEEVMTEVRGFFWDGEWIRWAIQDGKTIYKIAMSEKLVHFGVLQPDGTYIVIYLPKSEVSVMDSPGFLENQWMKRYFACEFGEVEGVWKLVKNLCFYGSGGPYQEPYG